MAKCEPGSEIYTDCINALQSVEEIGRLTLDHARDVGNTSQPAGGRGRQSGGRQGQGAVNLVSIIHLVGLPHLVSVTHQCPHLVDVPHLVSVPHLVGVTHLCPYLVSVTYPCMTTPWRKQVIQPMRCVWTLVMTWAPWHTMMRVHPIRLPIGTHLSPHPWFTMIPTHPYPLLHLCYPPPVRLPPSTIGITPPDVCGRNEMRFMPTPGAVPPK